MKFFLGFLFTLTATSVGVAAGVPDTYEVEHAVSIKARPSSIYPHLQDLRRWDRWAPWENLDPELKRTRSGRAAGKGAIYQWTGNDSVGRGRLEIVDTKAPSKIRAKLNLVRPIVVQNITLDFVQPFEADGNAEFELVERGGSTVVTWTLRGKHTLPDKFKGLIVNMEALLSYELALGLANLKEVVEG